MRELFFTVLVAIVAVGGALTFEVGGTYDDAFGNTVICGAKDSFLT